MYNFYRRLLSTQKAFEDLIFADENDYGLIWGKTEIFVMFARTVTLVLQKDLAHEPGFEEWYALKSKELSDKFGYFIVIRNEIEKEGKPPLKSFIVTFDFEYKEDDAKKIGTRTNPDGSTQDTMGRMTNTHFFDKDHEKELKESGKAYLTSLELLANEAIGKWPEEDK